MSISHLFAPASFHINTIKSELPSELVLKRAFDRDAIKKHVGSDVTQSTLLEEVARVLMGSGDTSRTGLSKRFVSPALQTSTSLSSARPTTLQIQYRNAARALRQQILHNVVIAKFESSGIRVIAVLSEMGKLDEKQVSLACPLTESSSSLLSRSPNFVSWQSARHVMYVLDSLRQVYFPSKRCPKAVTERQLAHSSCGTSILENVMLGSQTTFTKLSRG